MRDLKYKKIYQLDMREFEKIVEDVYGIKYDVQLGEYSQDSYINEDDVNGEPDSYQGYHKGLKEGRFGSPDYEDSSYVDLVDDKVVEYWRNHAPKNSDSIDATDFSSDDFGFRPFEKINNKGEYSWWQPDVNWILNDMVNRKEIPSGDYQILIWW